MHLKHTDGNIGIAKISGAVFITGLYIAMTLKKGNTVLGVIANKTQMKKKMRELNQSMVTRHSNALFSFS